MNNKSLVFTEKTIGRHTKRLQKELAKINHELKLSEAQNMLSRILGMKDYHELKQVLKFKDENFEKEVEKNEHENDKFIEFSPFSNIKFNEKFNIDFPEISQKDIILFLNKKENSNYVEKNAYLILSHACMNDELELFKLSLKYINLKELTDDKIDQIIYWLLVLSDKSIKIFDYLFFDLKIPQNLKFDEVGKIIYHLIGSGNVNLLDKFLKDDRVSFQKHFYWGFKKDSESENDFLGHAGRTGNLEMVKYLAQQHNLKPVISGNTILKSCYSGNLNIIKYLINELNANYLFTEENKLVDFGVFSTLTAAVHSGSLELVKYLIEEKKYNFEECDFVAIKKAFSECHFKIIKYFFTFPNVKENMQKHIEPLLNIVIKKQYDKNNSKYQLNEFNKNQSQIVSYICKKYKIQSFKLN